MKVTSKFEIPQKLMSFQRMTISKDVWRSKWAPYLNVNIPTVKWHFSPSHTIWNSFRDVLGGSLAPWIRTRRRGIVYKSYGILRSANTQRIHLYQYSVTLAHSIVLLLLMCTIVTCRPNACSATRLATNLKTFPPNSNTLFSEAHPS